MPLPKRRTPQPIQHRPVLAALKAKPCGRRGAPALTATARAPLQKRHAGMKKPIPAEPRNWTFACPIHAAVLITHSTGKGGLTAAQNNSHIL
jgi:hypothetical protein